MPIPRDPFYLDPKGRVRRHLNVHDGSLQLGDQSGLRPIDAAFQDLYELRQQDQALLHRTEALESRADVIGTQIDELWDLGQRLGKRADDASAQIDELRDWVGKLQKGLDAAGSEIASIRSLQEVEMLEERIATLEQMPVAAMTGLGHRLVEYQQQVSKVNQLHKEAVQNAIDAVQSSRLNIMGQTTPQHDALLGAIVFQVILDVIPYTRIFKWGALLLRSAAVRLFRSARRGGRLVRTLAKRKQWMREQRSRLTGERLAGDQGKTASLARQVQERADAMVAAEKQKAIKKIFHTYGKKRNRGTKIYKLGQLTPIGKNKLRQKMKEIDAERRVFEKQAAQDLGADLTAVHKDFKDRVVALEVHHAVLVEKTEAYSKKVNNLAKHSKGDPNPNKTLREKAAELNQRQKKPLPPDQELTGTKAEIIKSTGKNTLAQLAAASQKESSNPPPLIAREEPTPGEGEPGTGASGGQESEQQAEAEQPGQGDSTPEAPQTQSFDASKLPLDVAFKIYVQNFFDEEVALLEELANLYRDLEGLADSGPTVAWEALDMVIDMVEDVALPSPDDDLSTLTETGSTYAGTALRHELTAHYEFIIWSILLMDEFTLRRYRYVYHVDAFGEHHRQPREVETPLSGSDYFILAEERTSTPNIELKDAAKGIRPDSAHLKVKGTPLGESSTFAYLYARFGSTPYNPTPESLALRMHECAERYRALLNA